VEEISLDIRRGEFISIVGPSGCGKSTILLLVSGLIAPTAGTVLIDGQRLGRPYTEAGIVFQRDVLLEWRTVLQNAMLPAELSRLDRAASLKRARDLLELVGLTGFEDKYPSELSGGMRQRVAICRALIKEPPLLLMDEPFGALDALTREQMNLDLLRIVDLARCTVLFITHSVEEAVFLSDRVVVMSRRPGRILRVLVTDLGRPRTDGCRDLPAFHRQVTVIRDLFKTQGILSERRPAEEASRA
jgi:NitT/TauT family transport system ATP-binding protein